MAIAISYGQNCSTLQIISTTGGSVCGHGSAILSASASGTGNAIFWYDCSNGWGAIWSTLAQPFILQQFQRQHLIGPRKY